jgi:hypothetical protein
LTAAVRELQRPAPGSASSDAAAILLLPPRPTIKSCSRAFSLNRKQHCAFVMLAAALLRTIVDLEASDPSTRRCSHQEADRALRLLTALAGDRSVVMYLGGPGGTGKSRVISAIARFAHLWDLAAFVQVTATTGVAAVNIHGRTIHSAVGGGRWFSERVPDCQKLSQGKSALAHASLLVLDEVSFFGAKEVARLSSALRCLNPALDPAHRDVDLNPFGGGVTLFVGDFA